MEENLTIVNTPPAPLSSLIIPPPDLGDMDELLGAMKASMTALEDTFTVLSSHTTNLTGVRSATEAAHELAVLREQLTLQDKNHDGRIKELKALLREVVREKISSFFEYQAAEVIHNKVHSLIREKVEKQLQLKISQRLKDQVEDHRSQMKEITRNLHNTDARRHNGLLRQNQPDEPLRPLLRPNGELSPDFPKTLAELLTISPSCAKKLTREFGLPVTTSDTRERHLNQLLAHIGVAFQVFHSGGAGLPVITIA